MGAGCEGVAAEGDVTLETFLSEAAGWLITTNASVRNKKRNVWILSALQQITGISLSQPKQFAEALGRAFEYRRYGM